MLSLQLIDYRVWHIKHVYNGFNRIYIVRYKLPPGLTHRYPHDVLWFLHVFVSVVTYGDSILRDGRFSTF